VVVKKERKESYSPEASGLPYYCAPRVYVLAVLGMLTAWLHNKQKNKKQKRKERKKVFQYQKPREGVGLGVVTV